MKKIRGEQLYIFSGSRDALQPVGFSTDCALTLSSATVEGSRHGNVRRNRPGLKAWSVTSSGFCADDGSLVESMLTKVGQPITVAITVLQRGLVEAGIDLEDVAPSAVETLVGRAIITNVAARGGKGYLATIEVEYTGSGEIGLLRSRGGFPYILPLAF